jgi:hypothetical protein
MAQVGAKDLVKPPAFAPGKGVADALKHGVYMVKSKSIDPSSDTSPQYLFNVPRNVFVNDIVIDTTSGMASSYLIIGIASDCDMFFSDTSVLNLGSHSMKNGSNAALMAGGYNSSCDVVVEANFASGGAGTFTAYLFYSPYSNENYK